MNALPLIITALCVLVIAYRYYSAFLAAKVVCLDDSRVTPAHTLNDGQNYLPTNKWVLFGHHFAAISGAGPLIGPVLAVQFGYMPGFLWLLIGVVLAGAVHDFTILVASIRHQGKSLAEIARREISPLASTVGSLAIFIIVVIAMSGLGLAVVNALRESSWGTFTIGSTIPIAIFVGLWMFRFRKGKIAEGSIIGVIAVLAAVIGGAWIPHSPFAELFTLSRNQLIWALAIYGFFASILPVWLLLAPRDYLSSYMKIGTIAALVIGVIIVHPNLQMPGFSQFIGGGGPIIPGPVFPFVFITIACGAISGFHSLVSSGTTPKMLSKEKDARMIGYGAMLMEGLVGIVALIAASALNPGDYYAINLPVAKFQTMGLSMVNLPEMSHEVGEVVAGRPGGAVTLAIGIAQIFAGLPGMKHLLSYWYHFAIMFEALFILTTIDAGTRIGRFLVQEFLGKFYKPNEKTDIFAKPEKIGGWLILPAIGLILGCILSILGCILSIGDILVKMYIPSEIQTIKIIFDIILTAFLIYVTIRFFKKKHDAPELMILLMIITIIFDLIMLLIFRENYGQALICNILSAIIWILYFSVSKRVKRTFLTRFPGMFERTDWLPANIIATIIVVSCWAYFIFAGSISTVWPMFGTANQLLACVALCIATNAIINAGKVRYIWVTIVPLVFVATTTYSAAILNITSNFYPLLQKPETMVQGCVNITMTILIIACATVVLIEGLRKAIKVIRIKKYGLEYAIPSPDQVVVETEKKFSPPFRCC